MKQLFLLTTAATLAACSPKIQQFEVTPRRICAGTPVTITFKVRGSPHLTAERRGGAASDTTTYTIVATGHGDSAYSKMDVITFGSDQILSFTTDMLGHDSLVARDTLAADAWGGMQIAEVFADSTRGLVLIHGGKSAVLTSGGAAQSDWRGQPVSGAWELHAGLLHGEIPGNPAHQPPAHLYLRMSVACAVGGHS
jgi:hypothetical protein